MGKSYTVSIVKINDMEEHLLCSREGNVIAKGCLCYERAILHGQPVDDDGIVCEITNVVGRGKALYLDPIERRLLFVHR